jgi:hypothetical protein
VKGTLLRTSVGVVLLTAVLLALVGAVPDRRALFVGIYELVLGAIAVSALVTSFRTLEPDAWLRSPFERDPAKPEDAPTIAELERFDRLVVLGTGSEFDLHYRLRPLLRQLAADQLNARHGIEPDRDPERARPLLGDELAALLSPDRTLGRRNAAGIDAAELARHVGRLERL